MVKKLAIVAGILIVLGLIGAGIAFYQLDGRFGLLTAEVVSHDLIAEPETRLRVAVDTARLSEDLAPYMPEDIPLPAWMPWDLPQLLQRAAPYEVAILGGANFTESAFDLTVFINEKRGGPALPDYLNRQFQFQRRFPAVEWDREGFTFEERGIVSVDGQLPLPLELEDEVLEIWPTETDGDDLKLHGGHAAEALIDNRNGDLLALIGGLAPIWGTSLQQMRTNNPQSEAGLALAEQVEDLRLAVDFRDVDTLLLQFRIKTNADAGGQLEFMVPLLLGGAAPQIQARYRLTLEYDTNWDPEEGVYTCDVAVIGVEEKLKDYFRRIIPAAPQPAAGSAG